MQNSKFKNDFVMLNLFQHDKPRHSGLSRISLCILKQAFGSEAQARRVQDDTFYFLLVFLPFAFLLLTFPSVAFAHFLASDKNIGAVLHVDPNDEPIANSQAAFFFEFKDKDNKFDPGKCDCTFMILENGKQIYIQPLFQNSQTPSLTNVSVFYTFPKRDVYQVIVSGKSQMPDAFQKFTLTWDFRVDQQASLQTGTSSSNFFTAHLVHFFLIGVFAIFFIAYGIHRFIVKRKGDPHPTLFLGKGNIILSSPEGEDQGEGQKKTKSKQMGGENKIENEK